MTEEKLRLLVVDDDPHVGDMLMQHFMRREFDTRLAGNGAEGLALAQEFQPHAIVTDIVMPVMSGTDMIGEIRRRHPHIKIIAISGGGRMGHELPTTLNPEENNKILDLLNASEEKGALLSLQKPLEVNDLAVAIKLFLLKRKKF